MTLRCGIVGLPNVGKSSLFNALSEAGAAAENYPFCTIEPNVGVVPLPDPRLERIAAVSEPAQVVPASLSLVDIAGLVAGASKGEGLGNKFLAHIREVDGIVHVLRCFDDEGVAHVAGRVDPVEDAKTVELELILADMETVERAKDRLSRLARSGDKDAAARLGTLEEVAASLAEETPVRAMGLDGARRGQLAELCLLTDKPVLYCANLGESESPAESGAYARVRGLAEDSGARAISVSAKLESELAGLDADERKEMLAALGQESSGLDRLARAAFSLLGLATFFTTGPNESRAWEFRTGSTAPQAAGLVHTDMERGFIRAETVSWEDFVACGGEAGCRAAGKLRSEGRDYVVADGDVMRFRFNV